MLCCNSYIVPDKMSELTVLESHMSRIILLQSQQTLPHPSRKHFCKKDACVYRRTETRENKRNSSTWNISMTTNKKKGKKRLVSDDKLEQSSASSFTGKTLNKHSFLMWWLAFWCKGILSESLKVMKGGRQLQHMVWEKTQVVAGSLHGWRMHLVMVQRTQSQRNWKTNW